MFNINKIRKDFPILERKVHGKPLVFLDSAATSQKPKQVIEAMTEYYENYNSNVHRAIYSLAVEATEKYENTREKLTKFISANKNSEIVFGKNATEMFNVVLHSWAMNNLKAGDEIILTIMEHHSNIVPWQLLQERGVKLRYVDIDERGKLKMDKLNEIISKNTKLITFTHASNVLGTITPAKEICKIAHDNNCLALIDAAQSVPHMPVDVRKLNADFFIFSGHKMLGPTGTGVLYAKENILNNLPPFLRGSDEIKEVHKFETIFQDPPYRFETGTPSIAEVIGLGAAVDYLNKIGMKEVKKHEEQLTEYGLRKIKDVDNIETYGPTDVRIKSGVISFNFNSVHSHDVAQILDSEGIAIRSGHMCAMPLMERLKVPAVARASFYIYNTKEEIDAFIDSLGKVKETFKL